MCIKFKRYKIVIESIIMLKNKALLLTLSFVPFVLAACGGGDSSNNTNSKPNNTQSDTFANGESKLFEYDVNFEEEVMDVNKSEWSIKSDILHEKTENPIFYSYYVTEKDGLYIPETEQTYNPDRGIRDSFIHSMTPTEWVMTPYNQTGLKDLKFTSIVKEVDLQGQRIADQLSPSFASMYEFNVANELKDINPNALSSKLGSAQDKFGKGAKCIQVQKYTSNQVFFEFEPNISYEIPLVTNLQNWADQQLIRGNTSLAVPQIETWGQIKIGSLVLDGINYPVTSQPSNYAFALEYKSKVYAAIPQKPEWSRDEYEKYLQIEFKSSAWFERLVNEFGNAKAEQFIQLSVNKMKNQCDYYNTESAKNIDNLLNKIN